MIKPAPSLWRLRPSSLTRSIKYLPSSSAMLSLRWKTASLSLSLKASSKKSRASLNSLNFVLLSPPVHSTVVAPASVAFFAPSPVAVAASVPLPASVGFFRSFARCRGCSFVSSLLSCGCLCAHLFPCFRSCFIFLSRGRICAHLFPSVGSRVCARVRFLLWCDRAFPCRVFLCCACSGFCSRWCPFRPAIEE
ncbi:uncharacterized protein BYT42DRAFT_30332 [Radiomyces spectabilis]|uniref:uncharacterized protein n=1 Tax=Radiomyces spectabilis TaxID=64574 RepID=UPI0022208E2C|nr:uncharacterized protein BYT42DRAFT_30332 [Radiomyces spectabilis]KAI8394092.1 hypothetical protein BYT42DRAFT_30332 [Radiomyces spectabilis]